VFACLPPSSRKGRKIVLDAGMKDDSIVGIDTSILKKVISGKKSGTERKRAVPCNHGIALMSRLAE